MSPSKIEWTDETWNIFRGCSKKSEGCENCYAIRIGNRFCKEGEPFEGLIDKSGKVPNWTGKIRFVEKDLDKPLRWQRPRHVFVCSVSDFFHGKIPLGQQYAAMLVMMCARRHVFQVLTKRTSFLVDFFSEIKSYGSGIPGFLFNKAKDYIPTNMVDLVLSRTSSMVTASSIFSCMRLSASPVVKPA